MRILYLDCGMGAAGDMLMGALASLLSEEEQRDFVEELNGIGIPHVQVFMQDDKKCGVTGKHMRVMIDGVEEGVGHGHGAEQEAKCGHEHAISHSHENGHGYDHDHEHSHDHDHEHSHDHDHEHSHDHDHEHSHDHAHSHTHASMHDIKSIIGKLTVSDRVKEDVLAVYRLIAEAESLVHGESVSEIHFHEVGMMDAIADIAGCAMLMERLRVEKVIASAINVGFGHVRCAHGILPVPAPATANLLKGIPCYAGTVEGELCTPTGAALLRHYCSDFGNMPMMRVERVGYGTGNKDFEAANMVRAMLGETAGGQDRIVELQCNMDDVTAEELGYAMELLREKGARDVFATAITMKKGRPGTLLTVLCTEADKEELAGLIFRHTPTIGIRESVKGRMVLERRQETVHTPFGDVRVKVSEGYGVSKRKAEYEDLRKLAEDTGLSIREIKEKIKGVGKQP
ncbi:MAG: nickel pincer cofactor biosynthesis protein LarC [Butyrivibrio sp.]|nr:nickel pincer cofactor biosynthesis protein LarC [Muribaculum sp.]MCM1552797.1 nickel pincer cofactor biosynthesis protein LarC [Butyrivibrio sp.]